MPERFRLVATEHFAAQARRLPSPVKKQLKKRLEQLAADPKYPALGTHEVEGALGPGGKKIFEAYISMKYRMTWQYSQRKGEIVLRNVDNHDECLKKP